MAVEAPDVAAIYRNKCCPARGLISNDRSLRPPFLFRRNDVGRRPADDFARRSGHDGVPRAFRDGVLFQHESTCRSWLNVSFSVSDSGSTRC